MILNRFKNKKIAILGMGIENRALVDFFIKKKLACEITICDAQTEIESELKKQYPSLNFQLGKDYDQGLEEFDIISRVAGYPLFLETLTKAKRAKKEVTSPTKLFFELCPTKNIVGITGTKGKGTTSSLIYDIIKASGRKVFFGGNIGTAMFSFIEKIKEDSWVVLELSSFQTEDLEISPKIAVFTNFYREHLAPADPKNPNYHKTLADYWRAKANIFAHQKKGDYLVANEMLRERISKSAFESRVYYCEKSRLETSLVGEHNKENIAAAEKVAEIIGIEPEIVARAVKKFKGLQYRIQFIRELDGVKYYNDSFATTPEATSVALRAFPSPIVLLAGGADKGADFKQLAKEIKDRVKFVVLLHGKATPRLKKQLETVGFPKANMRVVQDIVSAVKLARQQASVGNIVLLSTACASFGMFKNYKERGKLFTENVEMLK